MKGCHDLFWLDTSNEKTKHFIATQASTVQYIRQPRLTRRGSASRKKNTTTTTTDDDDDDDDNDNHNHNHNNNSNSNSNHNDEGNGNDNDNDNGNVNANGNSNDNDTNTNKIDNIIGNITSIIMLMLSHVHPQGQDSWIMAICPISAVFLQDRPLRQLRFWTDVATWVWFVHHPQVAGCSMQ